VVADFGIARAVSSGAELLTEAGSAVGTPMYMSPEQVEGDPDLDGRSDIYSLGCVLFEALTGVPPFQGRSAQAILVRRLTESPLALRTLNPEIPAAVEAAVARALSREPADRFATAAGLSSALTDAARRGGAPGAAALVSGPQPVAEASVAVLPFLNLSSDPENEYFSDGMTDEIINALAQIPGLRVPARTSCFIFKGKNVDARQIGESSSAWRSCPARRRRSTDSTCRTCRGRTSSRAACASARASRTRPATGASRCASRRARTT
jgi:serine/threonine-protein kinase